MTREEALAIVVNMAKSSYAKDPTYPETLDRQREAIILLDSHTIDCHPRWFRFGRCSKGTRGCGMKHI